MGLLTTLARALCGKRGALCGLHRMTLIRLATTLATELLAERNLAPLSWLSIEALAARSVFVCRREGQLSYFAPVADTPGFTRALASTLNELRMEGVTSERLAASGVPGRDLAGLLDRYGGELRDRSLADLAVIFGAATEVVTGSSHHLLGLPLLLLDVPIESSRERTFLSHLVQRSPAVIATTIAEDGETLATLQAILGVEPVRVDDSAASGHGSGSVRSLDRLRRHIFSLAAPAKQQLDESVEFFSV